MSLYPLFNRSGSLFPIHPIRFTIGIIPVTIQGSSSVGITLMTARQSYHLTFARFSPSLSVRSFSASEAVNTAYRVEITATSTDSSLPLSSYLNQRAAFEIRPQEGLLSEVVSAFGSASDDLPAKQWQGIITSCEKLSVSKDETVYRFVLEPRFAALKHFQTSRLFQHQTVPDIVAAVFKHHGFPVSTTFPKKPQLQRTRVCDPVSRKRLRLYQPSV